MDEINNLLYKLKTVYEKLTNGESFEEVKREVLRMPNELVILKVFNNSQRDYFLSDFQLLSY